MENDALRSGRIIEKYKKRLEEKADDLLALMEGANWVGKYWFVAKNEFPYDKVAMYHKLIIPKRVFAKEWEMTFAERDELTRIKRVAGQNGYDSIMENTDKGGSVDKHYHLHLITFLKLTDLKHG